MKDLVEYIVKQLVTNPDAVSVEETTDGTSVNLLLKVDPQDMGIVIGKAGQTIKSIRKLLLVKAISDEVRVNLQLHDENRPVGESLDVSNKSLDSSEDVRTTEKDSEETPNPSTHSGNSGQADAQAIGSEVEPQAQARRDNKE